MAEGAKKGLAYDGTCGYCGAPSRPLFEHGRGKNAKRQRSRWRVCDNGHQTVRKVTQMG